MARQTIYLVSPKQKQIFFVNQVFDLNNIKLKAERLDYQYPQNREKQTIEALVSYAAKHSARKFSKNVLIFHEAIFIESLDGFPGVYTNFVMSKIKNKGLLELTKNLTDKKIQAEFVLGFCAPGKDTKIFKKSVSGQAIDQLTVKDSSFEQDWESIFVAHGQNKLFIEDPYLKQNLVKDIFIEFSKYYHSR